MKERAVLLEPEAAKAQIRTFHSFGSWLLRKYHEDAGVESSFTVYDDNDMVTLVKNACPSLSNKEAHIAAHQISLAKDYFLTPEDDNNHKDEEEQHNAREKERRQHEIDARAQEESLRIRKVDLHIMITRLDVCHTCTSASK